MSVTLGGPMFESSECDLWKSTHRKPGAHYNIFSFKADGLDGLRQMFPEGQANELNFALFSTSGVHGTYGTIEDAEADILRGNRDEDGEECTPAVTFLIVHPRIVCLRYGTCHPQNHDDIAYLKTLRASSWAAVQTIGKPSE